MDPITAAILLLVLMGLILGAVIGLVVKFFGVEVDERVEQIEEALPMANCGACGFAGCSDFARALVDGKSSPDQCPSTPSDAAAMIAALLGVTVNAREPQVALVQCGGGLAQAAPAARYNGVLDCKSAMIVAGGSKGCLYGCLGLGTCARACPFGAIEITNDNLAVVHPGLCTGCGKCVATCPRHLIALVPKSAKVHVYCNSPASGAATKKVCKVSCIGCRKCAKASDEGQMIIDGFLARVNYENPPDPEVAAECPTKCLRPALDDSAIPGPGPQTEEVLPQEQEVANG